MTLKVPITPGGALINRLNTALKDVHCLDGGHTKIVEEAGTMVSHLVSARPQLGCSFTKKCLIGESDCQAPNINYNVNCIECSVGNPVSDPPSLYIGTTGASIHHRSSPQGITKLKSQVLVYTNTTLFFTMKPTLTMTDFHSRRCPDTIL